MLKNSQVDKRIELAILGFILKAIRFLIIEVTYRLRANQQKWLVVCQTCAELAVAASSQPNQVIYSWRIYRLYHMKDYVSPSAVQTRHWFEYEHYQERWRRAV
jgi:hypothetical protein